MFRLNWKTFDKSNEAGAGAPVKQRRRPRIGVALGAGAARGWSHIGVLQELAAHGVKIDVVAGTSIGAVVGGCYCANRLSSLESFARSLTKRRVFSMMDLSFSGSSFLTGGKLRDELTAELHDLRFENLNLPFGAVATEIGAGHEIWLRRGNLVQAIRASYALPGIFEPVHIDGRWLFDGALVNPIPVTLCRALGADLVIAVNLMGDYAYRGTVISDQPNQQASLESFDPHCPVAAKAFSHAHRPPVPASGGLLRRQFGKREDGAPGIASAMLDAFNITQDRIARSRLAGDPPDLLINARLAKVGLFEFHRADELIEKGREAARRAMDEIGEIAGAGPLAPDHR